MSNDSHIILLHIIPEMQIPFVLKDRYVLPGQVKPLLQQNTGKGYEEIKSGALKMLEKVKLKCKTVESQLKHY